MDDPFDHNLPFDFFGLGQPANQNQFHLDHIAQPDEDHPNEEGSGRWRSGECLGGYWLYIDNCLEEHKDVGSCSCGRMSGVEEQNKALSGAEMGVERQKGTCLRKRSGGGGDKAELTHVGGEQY
jgi:hypothetical protein